MEFINLFLNIILFVVVSQLATITHEFGHAIPALIFTKDKVKITLGRENNKGKKLSLGRLNAEVRGFNPFLGFVHWNGEEMTKSQRIAATIGGPIISLILGGCLIFISRGTTSHSIKQITNFSANYYFSQFIITAIPIIYPKCFGGYGDMPSDGYRILKIIKK